MNGQEYRVAFAGLGITLRPEDGVPEHAIAAAEKHVGLRAPEALRTYYSVAGRETRLNRAHNRLIPPEEWSRDEGLLVFLAENQGVVLWAVPAGGDDPLVMQGSGEPGDWHSEEASCSTFLKVMLHWQAVTGHAFSSGGSARVLPDLQGRLDATFSFTGEVSGLRAYAVDQVALCLVPWDDGLRLFVASDDEDRLAVALAAAGLRWDDFDQA